MAHHDRVFSNFLERQREEGMALAAASELVDLRPLDSAPSAAYLARFNCTGLVSHNGKILEHDDFLVGIRFPDSYLRQFDTARVLTWCAPHEIWHPNIRTPFVCVGDMQPGTPLVDLLFQIHEIITYHNVEMREHRALNHDACAWARNHTHRFPVDRRPLKRRVRTSGNGSARPGPGPQQQEH
jgi:hypothetical protein